MSDNGRNWEKEQKEEKQLNMFADAPKKPQRNSQFYYDMPEFEQDELKAFQEVVLRFPNPRAVVEFNMLTELDIQPTTKSAWFPKQEVEKKLLKRWNDEE